MAGCNLLLPIILAVAFLAILPFSSANTEEMEFLNIIDKNQYRSARPCDSFYEYVCGSYPETLLGQRYNNLTAMAGPEFDMDLEACIYDKYNERENVPTQGQSFADKVAAYYYSCKNIEKKHWEPLKYFEKFEIKWPLIEEMKSGSSDSSTLFDDFDPFYEMGVLYRVGVRGMLIDHVAEGNGVTLKAANVTSLKASTLSDNLYYFDVGTRKEEEYANEILEFIRNWQYIFSAYGQDTRVQRLERDNKNIHTFVTQALPLQHTDDISVQHMDFFRYISEKQWTTNEKRIFRNYLAVKLMLHVRDNASNKCSASVKQNFGLAANYMYYEQKYLPMAQEVNDDLTHIIKAIEKSYVHILGENGVDFSPDQVLHLQKYVAETTLNVGNLPQEVTFDKINEYYRFLPALDVEDFYKNDLELLAYRTMETKLCTGEFKMICDTLITTPRYSEEQRLLALPFVALRSPFYDRNWNNLFKFSTLGFQLAHALTYSINPNILKTQITPTNDMFSNMARNPGYLRSLDCLRQQPLTYDLNERVADLMGARVAYHAYQQQYGSEPFVMDIPWKPLFFRSFGQYFCTNPKRGRTAQPLDVQKARLQAIVQNMDTFADAFRCDKGEPMSPHEQCKIF